MKREAPLSVRVPVAEQEAWKVQAAKAGLTLGGWVRMVCNASAPAERPAALPPQVEQLISTGAVKRGSMVRKGLCPHRVPAGSFCKRCEEG